MNVIDELNIDSDKKNDTIDLSNLMTIQEVEENDKTEEEKVSDTASYPSQNKQNISEDKSPNSKSIEDDMFDKIDSVLDRLGTCVQHQQKRLEQAELESSTLSEGNACFDYFMLS